MQLVQCVGLTWRGYRLYGNAKISDGGQIMLDLGSGYMEFDYKMANTTCAEDHSYLGYNDTHYLNGTVNPGVMVGCSEFRKCINDTVHHACDVQSCA